MNKKEDQTCVRIWKIGVLSLLLVLLLALTGCGKEAPEDYVKERLEKLQAGDDEMAEMLLQAGIESVDGKYVAAFPEKLKNRYREFLKKACGHFTYTVKEAEAYKTQKAKEVTERINTESEKINAAQNEKTAALDKIFEEKHTQWEKEIFDNIISSK